MHLICFLLLVTRDIDTLGHWGNCTFPESPKVKEAILLNNLGQEIMEFEIKFIHSNDKATRFVRWSNFIM